MEFYTIFIKKCICNGILICAGLNESTLRKEFKRIFGLSVGEFSRSQKIKHAKNLLRNTELSVYQIAEEIGYKNATHFTAAFKRLEGIAPLKFRNS